VIGLSAVGLAAVGLQGVDRADADETVSSTRVLDYGSSGPWSVTLVHDGQFFHRCSARRKLADGSIVYVALRRGHPDKAFIRLVGPTFGKYFVATSRGLVQVDNEPRVAISAERGRESNDTLAYIELDSGLAQSIKKGSILTIVLSGYKYAIPLTGTGKMMDALTSCAADGQAAVDTWAFENAVSATLGEVNE